MATSYSRVPDILRFCLSLKAGFMVLCFVYQVYFIWALTNSWPSLLLQTFARVLHLNIKTLSIAYNIVGIFIVILAASGMIVHERKFIIPVLFVESFSFFLHTFSCGYLLISNAFADEDRNFIKYVCKIVLGYFAIILEYRVYCELRPKRSAIGPGAEPETIIVLPSDASHSIDPRAVTRQCSSDRTRSSINNDFLRCMRGMPPSRSSVLPVVIHEDATFESYEEESVSLHPALSTVFCVTQSSDTPRFPPPRYEP